MKQHESVDLLWFALFDFVEKPLIVLSASMRPNIYDYFFGNEWRQWCYNCKYNLYFVYKKAKKINKGENADGRLHHYLIDKLLKSSEGKALFWYFIMKFYNERNYEIFVCKVTTSVNTKIHTIARSVELHEWINTNELICYDSRSLISWKNLSTGESARMTNNKCEFYEFFLHAICEYKSRIANTRIVWR